MTQVSARHWIISQTKRALTETLCGNFATPQGQIAFLDPLAFYQSPDYIRVPATGGSLVVFHDVAHQRNSKMALIFSDNPVAGGADVATCHVEAGMISLFTPATHANTTAFYDTLTGGGGPYNEFFAAFDEPQGAERKIVPLPDGTPVPYVHSGWGDGGYPVFTLTDKNGTVCAVYVDLMGRDDDGAWLTPPGVTLAP